MQVLFLSLGRILLASLFVISGVRKVMSWSGMLGYMQGNPMMSAAASYLQSKGLPGMEVFLGAAIALEIIGGLMVAFNVVAVPAAVLLASFCLVSGAIFHNFWVIDAVKDGMLYNAQLNSFLKNVSIAGGLLIAAGSTRRMDLD